LWFGRQSRRHDFDQAGGCEVMKLLIKKAACAGNARCAAVSEELFPLDDDGYIAVEEVNVPPGKEELARRGARACPERIIIIEEDK
jgi:ferredoxin